MTTIAELPAALPHRRSSHPQERLPIRSHLLSQSEADTCIPVLSIGCPRLGRIPESSSRGHPTSREPCRECVTPGKPKASGSGHQNCGDKRYRHQEGGDNLFEREHISLCHRLENPPPALSGSSPAPSAQLRPSKKKKKPTGLSPRWLFIVCGLPTFSKIQRACILWIVPITLSRSCSVICVPEGRHNPASNNCSLTVPPTARAWYL